MCKGQHRRKSRSRLLIFDQKGIFSRDLFGILGKKTAWGMVIFCLLLAFAKTPHAAYAAAANAPNHDLGTATPAVSTDYGLKDGSLAWGDYDNDGDLDLLVTGNNLAGASETNILTNHEGTLLKHPLGIEGVQLSSGAWGDYDNDGYLDILLTGVTQFGETKQVLSGVYHNVPASSPPDPAITREFTLVQELEPVYNGEGAWGDYDQDGFLDILLTGNTATDAPFSRIYRGNGSSFANSGITVVALTNSSAAWADFNLDGYTDFVISGKTATGTPVTRVYRNNSNGNFTSADLPVGVHSGTLTWIDTNNDGFLDLLVTGNSRAEGDPTDMPQSLLYRYTGSTAPYFTLVSGTGLDGFWASSVSSGDYDNDGLADLALFGWMDGALLAKIYTSDGDHTFTLAPFELSDPFLSGLSLAWGDYDQNGTLDLAVSGIYGVTSDPHTEHYYLNIYLNDSPPPATNAAPGAPILESACWDGGSTLNLRWTSASDDRTAGNALTYNLRLGESPDGVNQVSPGYLPGLGTPAPVMGNTYNGTQAVVRYLSSGDYYWSVQAVDASYTGGPFADNTGTVINYGENVAVGDSFTVEEDSAGTVLDILANDSGGAGGEAIRRYGYSQPASGTLSETVDGQLMYTPQANFYGTVSFNYYAIRESSKYCSMAQVTINVTPVNDPPTNITLSNNRVAEGSPVGTQIGYFTTTDIDSGQSHIYDFIDDVSNAYDEEYFSLFRDTSYTPPRTFLRTAAEMPPIPGDMEYQIQVRSTDSGSPPLSYTRVLTIEVVSSSPATSIALFDNRILEHQGANTAVGRVRTYMDSVEDTSATYELVADGSGNTFDNELFLINGTGSSYYLRARSALDYDEATPENNVYQVLIRSSNPAIRPPFEMLLDVYVDPTLPSVSAYDDNDVWQTDTVSFSTSEDGEKVVTMRAIDQGQGETLQWTVVSGPSHGIADLATGDTTSYQQKTVTYTPEPNWFGEDAFVVEVNDLDGNTDQITVSINVANVNDPPTLDPIGDASFPELSGPNTIHLTGITAGPPNEGGLTPLLTVTAVRPWYAYDPWPIFNYSTSAVVNGEADVTVYIGVGPGTYPLKIVVSDGSHQVSQDVQITVVEAPKEQIYLPLIIK